MTAAKYLDRFVRISDEAKRAAKLVLVFRAGFLARERTADFRKAWEAFNNGKKICNQAGEKILKKKDPAGTD